MMSEQESENAAVLHDVLPVERVFAEHPWLHDAGAQPARDAALQVLAACHPGEDGVPIATLVYAAELFVSAAGELGGHPRETAGLIARLDRSGLGRTMLAREVLRAPGLMALPPAQAVEAELSLLLVFAPVRSVTLWTVDAAGAVDCARHVGAGSPSKAARKLAGRLIAGEPTQTGPRVELFGLPVRRGVRAVAALLARAEPRCHERARALIGAALPTLEAVLERDALLSRNAASERALVETSERRLTRLGFDLHDGPLQELLLLGGDLRLFREQLGLVLEGRGDGELLRGRLDDLDARLVALEGGLRGISTSIHASALINRPFGAAMGDLVEAFTSRTGIRPRFTLEGEATVLSPSQRIALVSVVGEALNNVREHSDATDVRISVSLDATGVQAQVLDNGHGFDVEAALVGAARRGRIGLAGIHERVRLLGGQCIVESQPGGPTAVSLVLPRWEPVVDATVARGAIGA